MPKAEPSSQLDSLLGLELLHSASDRPGEQVIPEQADLEAVHVRLEDAVLLRDHWNDTEGEDCVTVCLLEALLFIC